MRSSFLRILVATVALAAAALACTDRAPTAEMDPGGGQVPADLVVEGAPPPVAFTMVPGPVRRDVANNWVVFADSNLWSDTSGTYVVWDTPGGSPMLGRVTPALTGGRLEGDEVGHVASDGAEAGGRSWEVVDLSTIPGNPLGAPTRADAHNTYAVAVDEGGRVHIAGNMHASGLRYAATTVPFDLDSFEGARMVGADEDAVTYPSFTTGPGGTLLFTYRDGSAADGDLILNTRTETGWERTATVLSGDGTAGPYPHHLVVEAGTIHLFHTWRTGPGAEGNTSLAYVASDDGGTTWRTVDGRRLDAPVGVEAATTVVDVDDLEPGTVIVNSGGAAVAGGRPHALVRIRDRAGDGALMLVSRGEVRWRTSVVPGTEGARGRGLLTAGADADDLLALWPAGRGDATLVMAAEVSDGTAVDDGAVLARLGPGTWEPVLDTPALETGVVSLLVPTGTGTGAGIVTWPAGRVTSPR